MKNKIINLITDYAIKIYFVPDSEKSTLRNELYAEAEQLHSSDCVKFEESAWQLLSDDASELEADAVKSKLECAQIWHRNGFDVWMFRILYCLNISPAKCDEILKQKIKAAFSCKEADVLKRHDAQSGYERLFRQVLVSDAPEDQNLRLSLEKVLTPELAGDVPGVVAYVAIKGRAKDTPSYMKTIYTAVTGLSVIEGDGLHGWITENKVRALKSLASALKKIGMMEQAEILKELYDYLTATDVEDPLSNTSVIERIEGCEARLMNSFDDNELMSAAENYLLNIQR